MAKAFHAGVIKAGWIKCKRVLSIRAVNQGLNIRAELLPGELPNIAGHFHHQVCDDGHLSKAN